MKHVYEIVKYKGDWVADIVCDLPIGCTDPYSDEARAYAIAESGRRVQDGFVTFYSVFSSVVGQLVVILKQLVR